MFLHSTGRWISTRTRLVYPHLVPFFLPGYSLSPPSPFSTKNPKKGRTKWSVRKLLTLLGHFWIFLEQISKTFFEPCSHIQSNTQNPNPIFKTTIYCTKYTNNAKIYSKKSILSKTIETSLKNKNVILVFIQVP